MEKYKVSKVYTDYELVEYRKARYWRGFRACLILIVAPIVAGLLILANWFINNNI